MRHARHILKFIVFAHQFLEQNMLKLHKFNLIAIYAILAYFALKTGEQR